MKLLADSRLDTLILPDSVKDALYVGTVAPGFFGVYQHLAVLFIDPVPL